MSKKPMIHEMLAIETDLSKTANTLLKETAQTFSNKPNLFQGANTETVLDDEKALPIEPVHTPLAWTVPEKLDFVSTHIANLFNVDFSLAAGNSKAKADVIIANKTIIKDAPALWLLGMESKLKGVRQAILTIPTLDPKIVWEKDVNHSAAPHAYVSKHPVVAQKTAKTFKYVVMDEATKEHKAQIHEYYEDNRVGEITKTTWSGMLPVSDKSRMLSNVDKLIVAVKKARQRANTTEVEQSTVGNDVMDYIFS